MIKQVISNESGHPIPKLGRGEESIPTDGWSTLSTNPHIYFENGDKMSVGPHFESKICDKMSVEPHLEFKIRDNMSV